MIKWYINPLQLQPGFGPQARPVQSCLAIVDIPLDDPGVDLQALGQHAPDSQDPGKGV